MVAWKQRRRILPGAADRLAPVSFRSPVRQISALHPEHLAAVDAAQGFAVDRYDAAKTEVSREDGLLSMPATDCR